MINIEPGRITANAGTPYAVHIVPHVDGGWAIPGGDQTRSKRKAEAVAEQLSLTLKRQINQNK